MIEISGRRFDPRLIVFDKDGTLIAFDRMWHAWFDHVMRVIAGRVNLDLQTRMGIAGTLGYDPVDGDWDPLGPLTIASTGEIVLLLAGQLYHHSGLSWNQALDIVNTAEQESRELLTSKELVEPIGDVRSTLCQFAEQGLVLALATTDNREPTERHLEQLGLTDLFAAVVCGDDGIPLKPAADMALEICRRVDIDPENALMVGDSVADMVMGRKAGFGGVVGVSSGPIPEDLLEDEADCVVADIHAIEVLKEERG